MPVSEDTQDPSYVIGFWDFMKGSETTDKGVLGRFRQEEERFSDAFVVDGALFLDGRTDYFSRLHKDDPFDISDGSVALIFSSGEPSNEAADVLIERGNVGDPMTECYFSIAVTAKAGIVVRHDSGEASLILGSRAGFFSAGDRVGVIYGWSNTQGGTLVITNLNTGAQERSKCAVKGLNFAVADNDGEKFTIGARCIMGSGHLESNSISIEQVTAYNRDITAASGADGNSITAELNDLKGIRDAESMLDERLKTNDAMQSKTGSTGDIDLVGGVDVTVRVNLGEDYVLSGKEDRSVFGKARKHSFYAQAEDDICDEDWCADTRHRGAGNDLLDRGNNHDDVDGDVGHDPLRSIGGADNLLSGAGYEDTVVLAGVGTDGHGENEITRGVKHTCGGRHVAGGKRKPIGVTPKTLIATPDGQVPIEDLRPGDKVVTRENGIQEISWAGARGLTGAELRKNPHLKPIHIAQGALGDGLPEHDLWLSPNQRVLVANDKTALYFEESEVLVSAKHLTALEGVTIADPRWTHYAKIMFEQHQIVLCNGSWSESFQPGDYSLEAVGNAQRLEIQELFPELETPVGRASYQAARKSLKRYEDALLMKG